MSLCWFLVLMIVDCTCLHYLESDNCFLCAVLFFRFIVSVFVFGIQYAFWYFSLFQAEEKKTYRLDVQVLMLQDRKSVV